MKKKRRDFLKLSTALGLGLTSGFPVFAMGEGESIFRDNTIFTDENTDLSVIGSYGPWASSLNEKKIPALSFRRKEFSNLTSWKKIARQRVVDRMSIPDLGKAPVTTILNQHQYEGLVIQELSWQLPYGRPTEGLLLKPANSNGKLPAILAFHDHGGNKYFGWRKIARISGDIHPMMKSHQQEYYENFAWANEIAKRGYVVLVPDAFAFGSRRVFLQDVPAHLRRGLSDDDPDIQKNIDAYNQWAGNHESIMAKSLFCAGTTWPAFFFAEDQKALDILYARDDVDKNNIGCCGLSGGGLRTVFMGGLDPRIKCAVDVGFMSTWKDFLLNKSSSHTWMTYVPLLPNELDFPEILGLRTPLPTLVLNDSEDSLYTLPEMKRAEEILVEVYKKAEAEDRFKCSFHPGPHKFDANMQSEAFEWFDRWLSK